MNRQTLSQWEDDAREPSLSVAELGERFARVEGVRKSGVDPQALAAWALDGKGPPPLGAAISLVPPSESDVVAQLGGPDVLAKLLDRVRDGALDVGEAAATIRTLFRAGLAVLVASVAIASSRNAEGATSSRGHSNHLFSRRRSGRRRLASAA